MQQAITMLKIQQENLLDALNYGEINDEYELQSKALDIEISNQLRIYRKRTNKLKEEEREREEKIKRKEEEHEKEERIKT